MSEQDEFEESIAIIHERLVALSGSPIQCEVIKKKVTQHTRPPLVSWYDLGGKLLPVDQTQEGGSTRVLGRDRSRWKVIIWAESRAAARSIYYNLIRAADETGHGPRCLAWGEYEWAGDSDISNLGEVMMLDITFFLDVKTAPQTLRPVQELRASLTLRFPSGEEEVAQIILKKAE